MRRFTFQSRPHKEQILSLVSLDSLNPSAVKTAYDELSEGHRNVVDSPYYAYAYDAESVPPEEIPCISTKLITNFYNPSKKFAEQFVSCQNTFTELSRSSPDFDQPGYSESAPLGREILENGYTQVASYLAFNNSSVAPPKGHRQLDARLIVQFNQISKMIGRDKEESFRETLRRYIPRWMTHAIPFENVQGAGQGRFEPPDVEFLTHPDNMALGLPLHQMLRVAEEIPDPENRYAVQTQAVSEVLAMEQEKIAEEFPFFHHVMIGCILGEERLPPKNAFFDYHTVISDIVRESHIRLESELRAGEHGPASEFMARLAQAYPNTFPDLLARSIRNMVVMTDTDEIGLLAQLKQAEEPWASAACVRMAYLPNRRVLTTAELSELSTLFVFPEEHVEPDPTRFGDDAAVVFSHHAKKIDVLLQQVQLADEVGRIDAEITYDHDENKLLVSMSFDFEGYVRTLPFVITLSEDGITTSIQTLEGFVEEPQIRKRYETIIAQALHLRAAEIREKESELERIQHRPNSIGTPVDAHRPTRDERKERYVKPEPLDEPVAVKKPSNNHIPDEPDDVAVEEDNAVTVYGLDATNIQALLDNENIKSVELDTFLESLHKYIDIQVAAKRMIGKRVRKSNEYNVNLRQITIDIYPVSLRVYLQDVGKGTFEIVAINKKQGEQQGRYINRLVKRLGGGHTQK